MPPAAAPVADLPTIDLDAIEVCRVGTHNGRPYTAQEFDQAVEAFSRLKGVYAPPSKLGHNDEQNLIASDGLPAVGWVSNLYRRGNALIADFAKVPAKFAALLKAGAWRNRSCEFWINTEFNGRVEPFMLKAVSWLGEDAPAVAGMDDVIALYNARNAAALATLATAAQGTVIATDKRRAKRGKGEATMPQPRSLVAILAQLEKVPDDVLTAFVARRAHQLAQRANLASGPKLSDIQSAVEQALSQTYPIAEGNEDGPGQDGPSCNVIDWFLASDPMSIIVSDQDVDNLWEIPFTYDDGADTATLGSPQPVKGTYTPNDSGMETGGDGADDGGDQGDAGESGATPAAGEGDAAQMARRTIAEAQETVAGLAELTDHAAVATLARRMTQSLSNVARLDAGALPKEIQAVLAALDKAMTSLSENAAGKPGMGFIRTALSKVRKEIAGLKFPAPAVATNSRTGGTEVNLQQLAAKFGLPATATEAEVNAAIEKATATNAVVTTLAKQVETLTQRDETQRTEALLLGAVKQGRLKKSDKPDSTYQQMLKLAKADFAMAETVVNSLPPFVDLTVRGYEDHDAGAPELSEPVARLARQYGDDPATLADATPLAELERRQREELQKQRMSRFQTKQPATA